ncbi:MAG: hypothetical protein WCG03_04690 [Kiritimatiellales bacterium]
MHKTLILLTALLILAGCATAPAPIEFPVSPMMATTYAGGEMAITWKAENNQNYTIYYTDALPGTRADWKPLPQATGLRGSGKQITIRDKVSSASQRRYMLLSGNQKPPY